VVPNLIGPGRDRTGSFLLRSRVFLHRPRLQVTQGGRLLGSYRLRRMIPNRSHPLPSGWLGLVGPEGDVHIAVAPDEPAF
jgi:hypothetical protein